MEKLQKNVVVSGGKASMVELDSKAVLAKSTLIGKDFVVLPSTMMVEGAYCPYIENMAEKETLFFPGEELAKSANSWNGRPVSINHPSDNETCNSPDAYKKQWIGFVFNSKYDRSAKKLTSELWIDASRGSDIVACVEQGKNIDVSIGAYGDLTQTGETIDGVAIDYRMSNIVGDHLAVLPDGVGACSWKDGCGIRAKVYVKGGDMECHEECGNSEKDAVVQSALVKARTPSYDGTESIPWGNVSKTFNSYLKGYYKHTGAKKSGEDSSVEGLPAEGKRWIASKTLLGDQQADTGNDLIFFPVVNPGTNKLNEGALRAVISGRGSQADISEAARDSAQNKARSLLKSEFKVKTESGANKMTDKENIDKVDREEKDEPNAIAAEGKFDMDGYLDTLPIPVRNYMVNSMKNYESTRVTHVNKILKCSQVNFCAKEIGKIMDMKTLENIASLVDMSKGNSVKATRGATAANYQFRAASGADENKEYATFKDIKWTN